MPPLMMSQETTDIEHQLYILVHKLPFQDVINFDFSCNFLKIL